MGLTPKHQSHYALLCSDPWQLTSLLEPQWGEWCRAFHIAPCQNLVRLKELLNFAKCLRENKQQKKLCLQYHSTDCFSPDHFHYNRKESLSDREIRFLTIFKKLLWHSETSDTIIRSMGDIVSDWVVDDNQMPASAMIKGKYCEEEGVYIVISTIMLVIKTHYNRIGV